MCVSRDPVLWWWITETHWSCLLPFWSSFSFGSMEQYSALFRRMGNVGTIVCMCVCALVLTHIHAYILSAAAHAVKTEPNQTNGLVMLSSHQPESDMQGWPLNFPYFDLLTHMKHQTTHVVQGCFSDSPFLIDLLEDMEVHSGLYVSGTLVSIFTPLITPVRCKQHAGFL